MERFAQMELSVFRDFISFILRGGSPLRVYGIPPLNCAVIKFLSPPDGSLRWPSFFSIALTGLKKLTHSSMIKRRWHSHVCQIGPWQGVLGTLKHGSCDSLMKELFLY